MIYALNLWSKYINDLIIMYYINEFDANMDFFAVVQSMI